MTGFDRIGLPVVFTIRPNARSETIQHGKGMTLEAAIASSVMESFERFHAEAPLVETRTCTYEEIPASERSVDWRLLPKLRGIDIRESSKITWAEAINLSRGKSSWIPYEMIHTNFSFPFESTSGIFPCTSNGLASGNNLSEAIAHGICEVLERDAATLFASMRAPQRASRRIDLTTIEAEAIRNCIDLVDRAGLDLGLWDMTSDLGVACVCACITEPNESPGARIVVARGEGADPSREIAVLRAITEAAQGRIKFIAGAEAPATDLDVLSLTDRPALRTERIAQSGHRGRDYASLPNFNFGTPEKVIFWLLERLGSFDVFATDLSRESMDVSVVRIVIPGLENGIGIPGYMPGARAMSVMNAA